jgi:hypothetical protein
MIYYRGSTCWASLSIDAITAAIILAAVALKVAY